MPRGILLGGRQKIDPKLCAICRGRGLCGLSYCPLVAKHMAMVKLRRVYGSRELYGSSPPSVFVGRYGYPYVNIGPSLPPVTGDTSIYDLPEKWIGLSLEKILDHRWSLVTGSARVKVDNAMRDPIVLKLHELVLSTKPVETEIYLEKPPRPRLVLSEYEPPQGPRAPLREFRVTGNPWIPRVVDKVYSDTDLKAADAVIVLYRSGVPVTHIQKMFSVGALGTKRFRRLVPTRWSITAVDDIASRSLISEIKSFDELSYIEVFVRRYYDNLFIAILVPGKWSFEWMEAWWPGSTWNPGDSEVIVEGDYEDYRGRTSYPEIGGCYYASRLAVAEYLYKLRRQAEAILLREIYPGFNLPIGVWFVRENLRAMFRGKPVLRTQSIEEALAIVEKEAKLGVSRWIKASRLLQRRLYVRKLTDLLRQKRDIED